MRSRIIQKFLVPTVSFQKVYIPYRLLLLPLAGAMLLLPRLKPTHGEVPDLVHWLGRFHPLVVHFPVVLVLMALLFELARKFRIIHISAATIGVVLGFSLAGSLASVGMGFLLYYTGEYTGEIMQGHLWGGVLLTSVVAITLFLFLTFRQYRSKAVYSSYLTFLVLANGILIYTSHQGGSLTHGSEYLSEHAPKFNRAGQAVFTPKAESEMLVYHDVVVPVLNQKCMSCHNENKAKGDLIMTTYEAMLKGGKGEHPTLVPGSAKESDMFRRVMLPEDDDDHMPTKGKPNLTKDEIELIAWWINHGADTTMRVPQMATDQQIKPVLTNYLTDLKTQQRTKFLQQQSLKDLLKEIPASNNVVLQLDPYDEKGINLSMPFPPGIFADKDIIKLQPLFPSITKASVMGSEITDDALYHIGQMSALQELYLQQTKIDGSGLIHLSSLKNLHLLDLSKTQVNDGQLLHVLQLPALEDLILYETTVSKEVVEAIRKNKPDLNVKLERGKFF
ncbi:c-type cytochrome domain-containing protein [Adhaeribacter aquaticus]|uniref:c-type cytochrome domain-containing protein n=1 Tax=Adhaeribacter aquaticus TaxID=299567 RepID=UPI0003F82851|nr:c-type cytochrome domain-containing protein [Adhaeribacter aquaticus]